MPRTDYHATLQNQNEQSYNSRYRQEQTPMRSRRYGNPDPEQQYEEETRYQPSYSRVQRNELQATRYQPAVRQSRQSRYALAQNTTPERTGYVQRNDENRWESNGQRRSYYGNDYGEDQGYSSYEQNRQMNPYQEEPQREPQRQEQPVEEVMMEQPKEHSALKYLVGALGGAILVAIIWVAFYLHEAGMLF